eukprot:scaffold3776_cov192-Alexandrium_tamarense.AAC.16
MTFCRCSNVWYNQIFSSNLFRIVRRTPSTNSTISKAKLTAMCDARTAAAQESSQLILPDIRGSVGEQCTNNAIRGTSDC